VVAADVGAWLQSDEAERINEKDSVDVRALEKALEKEKEKEKEKALEKEKENLLREYLSFDFLEILLLGMSWSSSESVCPVLTTPEPI